MNVQTNCEKIAPLEAGTWGNGTWGNGTWGNGTWGNGTWGNSILPTPVKHAKAGESKLPIIEGITWSNITWSNITWSNITWSNITWSNTIAPVPNARASANREIGLERASNAKRAIAKLARTRGEVVVGLLH